MYHKYKSGSMTVMTKNAMKKVKNKFWQGAHLVIINDETFSSRLFSKAHPCQTAPIRLYFDDNDLYMSDYYGDEDVIDRPVDAIIVYRSQIKVFVNGTLLVLNFSQFPDYAVSSDFYPTLQTKACKDEPSAKKVKVNHLPSSSGDFSVKSYSAELIESYCTDISEYVAETVSESSRSTSSVTGSGEHYQSKENVANIENHSQSNQSDADSGDEDLLPVRKIKGTKLDENYQKIELMDECKRRLDYLFKPCNSRSKSRIIPVSQIVSPQFDTTVSDPIIDVICQSIEDDGAIKESDPITVVQKGDKYFVLSGIRRIRACQRQGLDKITCQTIETEDEEIFTLRKFFRENTSTDIGTFGIITFIRRLLNFLDLPPSELEHWKDSEMKYTFGSHISVDSKIGRVLKVAAQPVLFEELSDVCSQVNFTSKCIYDMGSKFRMNPNKTISLIREIVPNDFNEKEFRKVICLVEPDLTTILRKKHMDEELITKVMRSFSEEDQFIEFISGADLRTIKADNYFDYLSSRFQRFKECTKAGGKRRFTITSPNETTDLVITANSKTAINWLQSTQNPKPKLAIVFGQRISNASIHSLIVPPEFGEEDEFFMTCNRITVSIFLKETNMISSRGLSSFFHKRGLKFMESYTLDEFPMLLGNNDITFVDLYGSCHLGLIVNLIKHINHIQVQDAVEKTKIEASLNNVKRVQ